MRDGPSEPRTSARVLNAQRALLRLPRSGCRCCISRLTTWQGRRGDTVTVLDADHRQHKIRLAGIDAPEKAQPFGQRSKENLPRLVFGREVVVEVGKTDRYRREVGKISIDGIDANLEQVKAGLAWHYKAYAGSNQPRTGSGTPRRKRGPVRQGWDSGGMHSHCRHGSGANLRHT
jgi:hypothetical protein